ncbi:alpha/beta hydrolase [Clostridium sp. 19966]|uniref:alpha/beta hydrolase n=1 Tax=Clostridium sp. 19966 TaxID=2768166 RepID=UPI0028DEDF44|nr:alpha/beta hydrolase [Clostridium sp. 19966]MDT8719380.1 alpha/beta hydrolase [Clostridium sp. 19966]
MNINQNHVIKLELPKYDLEWLYVPDVVYAEYDNCKRHVQLIVPYRRNWHGEKYPLIVFVPGSAWYKQDMYSKVPMLGRLAERGYAVAAVEYRESTIAPFPAQVQDVKAAIRFLRSKAEEFHLDGEKVFVFGDSSGGHTALLVGLTENIIELDTKMYQEYSCKVNGIIDFFGPTDITKCREESAPEEEFLVGGFTPTENLLGGVDVHSAAELAEKASCKRYIDKAIPIPPVLVFHGTEDAIVSINQSILLYNKLIKEEKEAIFYSVEGGNHGGAMYWCSEVMDIIEEFIKKHI